LRAYQTKASALKVLVNLGVDLHIYAYEKFLEDGLDYLGRVAKVVGLDKPGCEDTFKKDKKRTHSGKRCDTQGGMASNCDELQALFDAQNFPTFKDLIGDHYSRMVN